MPDNRKQLLMDLGAETLADTLLELAGHNEQVNDKINSLTSAEKVNIKRYRQKLAGLRNSTRYIGLEMTDFFADQLERMLTDLETWVTDPCTGLDLVAEFIETDAVVFEMCDDSDGTVGGVYLSTARNLFFHYASLCLDKERVATLFIRLVSKDDYGARSSLMKDVVEELGEPALSLVLKKLQALEANEKDAKNKRSYTWMLESITSQQREADLFAAALQGRQVDLSVPKMLEVARAFLEKQDAESALAWVQRIPANDVSHGYEIEQILKEIYTMQGDRESLVALQYKRFRSFRTQGRFEELLLATGREKREEILANEWAIICQNPSFNDHDAQFLSDVGMMDELEAYVFARVETLHEGSYYTVPEIAAALAKHGRYLAASLLYRSLLDCMMERAYAKSYHHGVDYLNALDAFAPLIKDWKTFSTHNSYKVNLLLENKRKTAFWNQYRRSKG
ncbi:MAG: hypothetical protein VB088_13095 [Sphaerochaeta sp.]|nr:hypothetical protein [Sphaerochaeta sp.]